CCGRWQWSLSCRAPAGVGWWEWLVSSCCRAHLVIARRQVVGLAWWWNPLYRDTDLRRRMIRRRECVVGDRTNEASGRDEKDVGVHSCNCGVAEKSAARWLTCIAVETHAKTGTLFCMEWRAAMLRGCTNGTTRPQNCPGCLGQGVKAGR